MVERTATDGQPYAPSDDEWGTTWAMLCGHCAAGGRCDIVDGMIEMKDGHPWPAGGWVTDPGAGVTCLSYRPLARRPVQRQQLRHLMRMREGDLPPVCGGCAALKGSEASVSLHTQRDYAEAVRSRAPFLCHEDPAGKRLCGGWCRSIQRRAAR
jgi:hypothetical protein